MTSGDNCGPAGFHYDGGDVIDKQCRAGQAVTRAQGIEEVRGGGLAARGLKIG